MNSLIGKGESDGMVLAGSRSVGHGVGETSKEQDKVVEVDKDVGMDVGMDVGVFICIYNRIKEKTMNSIYL